jgi:hypothetical protein
MVYWIIPSNTLHKLVPTTIHKSIHWHIIGLKKLDFSEEEDNKGEFQYHDK